MKWPEKFAVVGLLMAVLLHMAMGRFTVSGHTAEGAAPVAIYQLMSLYAEKHDGKLATSWKDLASQLSGVLRIENLEAKPTSRYVILQPPLPAGEVLEGDIVALNRSPIHDVTPGTNYLTFTLLEGPGRYVVCRNTEGHFGYSWMKENDVKKLFQSAGRKMPEADSEPLRSWVVKARINQFFWTIYLLTCLGILARYFWKTHFSWRLAIYSSEFSRHRAAAMDA